MARPFSAPKPLPTRGELLEMLDYNSDTGILKWRLKPEGAYRAKWWNSRFGGEVAGSNHPGGNYIRIMIGGAHHFAHRIIWKMVTGNDAEFVDHINGDASDNRWENLRDVSFDENLRNKPLYKNNTSGTPGVTYHSKSDAWAARIGAGGKQLHLGDFKTKVEAVAAIRAAHVILNYHRNHGRKADHE